MLAAGTQFVPAVLVVAVGETVTWETPVLSHTVSTAESVVNAVQWQSNDRSNGDADPDTFHASLAPARLVTHAFAEAGTYPYFCALHRGMVGSIVVVE